MKSIIQGKPDENLSVEQVLSFSEAFDDVNPTHGNWTTSRFSTAAWMYGAVLSQSLPSYGRNKRWLVRLLLWENQSSICRKNLTNKEGPGVKELNFTARATK